MRISSLLRISKEDRKDRQRAAAGKGLYVNAHKTEYMCYNQTGDISTLDGNPLKLVDKFTYLGSSVASTEKDIDTRLTKVWTAINTLSIIWKSNLTDKMKRSFFQAAVTSILLYGCTTWTLTKRPEKKLDGNYTRMLRAILNKSWRQHPTRHQLYGHLPPITKTVQVRRTRHAGHCWRNRAELIRDVLLWTPTHGRAKAGRPARTYIQQLCEDTGCCPEDVPRAMNDREEWRERIRDIRAPSATWWIYETLCFNVALGRMNGAPTKTRTHFCRFGSQTCQPLHKPKCPINERMNLYLFNKSSSLLGCCYFFFFSFLLGVFFLKRVKFQVGFICSCRLFPPTEGPPTLCI